MPYIVRQCIEEVEKRGIDEVGIYRISGVATDIQALKTAFDTSEALSYHDATAAGVESSCAVVHLFQPGCACVRLTCRYQRHPGDAERHGHQRHRGDVEAVLQGAARASAHRPAVPSLHGGHRSASALL